MLLKAKNLVDEKVIELRERVEKLEVKPKLVIIRVGDDPASEKYVNNKIKKCHETNMLSEIIHFDKDVESSKVEEKIIELNNDDTVTGMLLQLPLPAHLDEDLLTQMIDEKKDVDGFTISNIGRLTLGLDSNIACTPKGIISLLKYYNIPMEGQNVLVINRSNIVGKPLALLFLRENATVTIAHSRTKDLEAKIKNSDIVVTAVGRAAMFNADNFTPGTTIIDVSINFKDGKICGDVDKTSYDELLEKSCNITPVPGGVGPMTVLSLIEQTVEIQEKNIYNRRSFMKYSKIRKFDIANGPGVRTTLFVSGCTHNCEGCFNKEVQNFSYGEYWTKEIEDIFIKDSSKDVIVGINILGGEPMQQKSEDMLRLVKRLKEETKKPIWLWSGCLWEELIQKPDKVEILKYVDVLIDGKFQIDKRDLMLKYMGSSNQRVIDVQRSLEENTLKLVSLEV